jgi:hypothetical protein
VIELRLLRGGDPRVRSWREERGGNLSKTNFGNQGQIYSHDGGNPTGYSTARFCWDSVTVATSTRTHEAKNPPGIPVKNRKQLE